MERLMYAVRVTWAAKILDLVILLHHPNHQVVSTATQNTNVHRKPASVGTSGSRKRRIIAHNPGSSRLELRDNTDEGNVWLSRFKAYESCKG